MLDGPKIKDQLRLSAIKWRKKVSWIEFLDDVLIYHKGKLKERFVSKLW